MPKYIAPEEIRLAVERLEGSSPFGRIFDYLVGMRALKLALPETETGLGTRDEPYVRAANELARWSDDHDYPFFSPFSPEAKRFKGDGWLSNGVPSNVWKQQSPAFTVHQGPPKKISKAGPPVEALQAALLNKGAKNKPQLIDAAIWYFRSRPFPDEDLPDDQELCDMFMEAMGLTDDEADALFAKAENGQ